MNDHGIVPLPNIEKRDACNHTFEDLESTVEDLTWRIHMNEAKIDKLEKLIAARDEEKEPIIEELEEVTVQMEAMEKQRT